MALGGMDAPWRTLLMFGWHAAALILCENLSQQLRTSKSQ